jgi:hypothetical protein
MSRSASGSLQPRLSWGLFISDRHNLRLEGRCLVEHPSVSSSLSCDFGRKTAGQNRPTPKNFVMALCPRSGRFDPTRQILRAESQTRHGTALVSSRPGSGTLAKDRSRGDLAPRRTEWRAGISPNPAQPQNEAQADTVGLPSERTAPKKIAVGSRPPLVRIPPRPAENLGFCSAAGGSRTCSARARSTPCARPPAVIPAGMGVAVNAA